MQYSGDEECAKNPSGAAADAVSVEEKGDEAGHWFGTERDETVTEDLVPSPSPELCERRRVPGSIERGWPRYGRLPEYEYAEECEDVVRALNSAVDDEPGQSCDSCRAEIPLGWRKRRVKDGATACRADGRRREGLYRVMKNIEGDNMDQEGEEGRRQEMVCRCRRTGLGGNLKVRGPVPAITT